MIKKIGFIVSIFIFQNIYIFAQEAEMQFQFDSVECLVTEIDSIDNFYIINVLSKENKYKIISRKMSHYCVNIFLGKTYVLNLFALFPTSMNFLDQRYHIGRGVFIEIDWGNNLYQAQELCGLCYEINSMELKKCKQSINQQDAFENAMLYIYFHYKVKKNEEISFIDFYQEKEENSIPFVLISKKPIPIYTSPITDEIACILFTDTTEREKFKGNVFYEYKNLYFIRGRYDKNVEILGWVDKKYFSQANLQKSDINYKR